MAAQELRSTPHLSRRVLVVDDNQDAADCLTALVRLWGHEARTAYDGAAALETARGFVPQVVLLDISMPGMDGYEVARRLRQEHGRAPTIVATTGLSQDEDRRRSREAGFDAHWVKPIHPEELKRLLTRPGEAGFASPPGFGDGASRLALGSDPRSSYAAAPIGEPPAVAGC